MSSALREGFNVIRGMLQGAVMQPLNNIAGTSTERYRMRHAATDNGRSERDYAQKQTLER